MQVIFDRSFSKALGKIKDQKVLEGIENAIFDCEAAGNVKEVKNLKKLTGFKSFYRIKTGDYRIVLNTRNLKPSASLQYCIVRRTTKNSHK